MAAASIPPEVAAASRVLGLCPDPGSVARGDPSPRSAPSQARACAPFFPGSAPDPGSVARGDPSPRSAPSQARACAPFFPGSAPDPGSVARGDPSPAPRPRSARVRAFLSRLCPRPRFGCSRGPGRPLRASLSRGRASIAVGTSPGMRLAINLEQLSRVQVGVALRRAQACVSKKLLNRAQVRPAPQEMRGKRVPQRVRAHAETRYCTTRHSGEPADRCSVDSGGFPGS